MMRSCSVGDCNVQEWRSRESDLQRKVDLLFKKFDLLSASSILIALTSHLVQSFLAG